MNDEDREEEAIRKLIRSSGRGPVPSDEARARIYAAVRDEWRRSNPVRRARSKKAYGAGWSLLRPMPALAAAFAVTLAVALGIVLREPGPADRSMVASVSMVVGPVASIDPRSARAGLRAGEALPQGYRIETGIGGSASLDIGDQLSLRVGGDTLLRFADADTVELLKGRVYLDSGAVSEADDILVLSTRFGDVRHVGTQYELLLESDELRVRVREGEIAISTPGEQLRGAAGEQLLVSGGSIVDRGTISPSDDAWQWTEGLVTLPPAAEHELVEVLQWAARQTGRDLQFEQVSTEQTAGGLQLHNAGGLSPREVLDVMQMTTGLRYRFSNDSLVVY